MSRSVQLSQHCILFFGNKTSNTHEKKSYVLDAASSGDSESLGEHCVFVGV